MLNFSSIAAVFRSRNVVVYQKQELRLSANISKKDVNLIIDEEELELMLTFLPLVHLF